MFFLSPMHGHSRISSHQVINWTLVSWPCNFLFPFNISPVTLHSAFTYRENWKTNEAKITFSSWGKAPLPLHERNLIHGLLINSTWLDIADELKNLLVTTVCFVNVYLKYEVCTMFIHVTITKGFHGCFSL